MNFDENQVHRCWYIKKEEISARVVGIPDVLIDKRLNFIKLWIESDDFHNFNSQNTRILSQVGAQFDVLILHGRDVTRISRISREWRTALPAKSIFVVMNHVDARIRSEVLMAGADAVIAISEPPEDAAAQLRAIFRRVADRSGCSGCGSISLPHAIGKNLNNSEKDIASILWKVRGTVSNYSHILNEIGREKSFRSMKILQIMIHKIRKKIPKNIEIINVKNVGYSLAIRGDD